MIGESVRRLEDAPLIRGRGRFIADLAQPSDLYLRVVRSPVAHGRLRNIDVSALRGMPGVFAFTADDLPDDMPPIATRQEGFGEMAPYLQPVLARGRVRYVGEPVAVVLAGDSYAAEDASELVELDIDELPVHLSCTAQPVTWDDEGHSTEVTVVGADYGGVDDVFAGAAHVVELELAIGRHSGVPLETRGVRAHVDEVSGVLIVEGAAKVQHYNRRALASMLGMPLDRIHLHEGHVGGGFGVRGELYPEDVLVAWAALRLHRAVTWIEDRLEHLVATNHSRDQVHRIRAATSATGEILAIDDEFWLDQGAYVRTHGITVPAMTVSMLPGPYRVPSYRCVGHVRVTNKTPAGTYRAPGRYEATFARERLLDAIAHTIGLDRAEVRRINFIRADEMPYRRPMTALGTELEYDSGDYSLLLDRLLDHVDYRALVTDLDRRRLAGEMVGLGFGAFVEKSGLGPYEGVRISVDSEGSLRVLTGVASVGQGIETAVAQIISSVLGVNYEKIRVSHGQTDELDYGFGSFATRATVMAGSAAHLAALAVRDKALRVAADLLEADPGDLELVDGSVRVFGTPARSITLGAIAGALDPAGARRIGTTPGLSGEAWFEATHMTYPYGIHLAVVRLDGALGAVTIERFVVAYDIGKAVNPLLIEGQICGGVAQGIGGALLEEFRYDPQSGQPESVSFMDYLMPTMSDVPYVELLLTQDAPSPLNPIGVKGAGEGGTTGVGAAIAGAVDDALGLPGAVRRLPISPNDIVSLILDALR